MESVTILQRTGLSRSELRLMWGLFLIGEVGGAAVSYATRASHPELSKAFVSGTVALFFGALLGGIVTQLLAELDRRRVRRASEIEYITNILNSLKSAYDQVDRAGTLIAAHQSAKTYDQEMQKVIAARVGILQVIRALKFDARRESAASALGHVMLMESYLDDLIAEFEQHYKEVSREQSVYEARMRIALAAPNTKAQDLPTNTPWDRIVTHPRINDFLRRSKQSKQPKQSEQSEQSDQSDQSEQSGQSGQSGQSESSIGSRQSDYDRVFVNALDDASAVLRDALVAEFGERRVVRGTTAAATAIATSTGLNRTSL